MSATAIVIAHRAGDRPDRLAEAAAEADVLEADVRLFHGRLEVRHAKSIGPIPVLWEKWHLVERTRPPLVLADLLAAMPGEAGLVLDLKGPDPRMAGRVLRATAEWRASRPLLVCGRVWRTIDRMRGHTRITTVHSAGSPRQLRTLLRRPAGSMEGASVDRRLLTRGVVEEIRARVPVLWAWGVDDATTARELAGWGITGMISDHPGALRDRRMPRSAANEPPTATHQAQGESVPDAGVRAMSAPLTIRCECGHLVRADDEQALLAAAREHIAAAHADLVGTLSDDDLRRMASGG